MVFKISTQNKQEFLKWFLRKYEFSSRENKWILEMFLKQPEVLEQVNFVKSTKNCPRSISMSTKCSGQTEFIFTKNKLVTIDQHKAYHDLRLNTKTPIYVKLNYKDQEKCPKYGFITIDNPFEKNNFLLGKDKFIANENLDEIAQHRTIELLNEKINQALDENNKQDFHYFSDKLSKMKNK